ncbi:MAG: hypothetical protein ACO25B_11545 [Chitinophagaceae bacterium]
MNAKTTIRKIIFIAIWLSIGGGMFTLLLAAISSKKNGHCSDYTITLKGSSGDFFINQKEVESVLEKSCGGAIRGQAIASMNLNAMENLLEKNPWISGAELYIDSRDILHVVVTEKEPVARIFTTEGNSFYLDVNADKMPLSEHRTARVPVFTGFPDRKRYTGADSLLIRDVTNTALYIRENPFWMSQVAQIDITSDGKMELIPVVGNHLVRLGDGENIPAKFNRLLIFYRQVLSKTGFDKYKLIDVQYKGQVVVSRYAGDPRIDSVQLRKNVEKLMKYAEEAAQDSVVVALTPMTRLETDSVGTVREELPAEKANNPEKNNDPNPRLDVSKPALRQTADGGQAVKTPAAKPAGTVPDKSAVQKPSAEKQVKKPKEEEKRVPKAVMPKKTMVPDENGYQ